MATQRLTRRQVLRRRRIVVLTGLLLVVLGLSAMLVRAGQAVWDLASEAFGTRTAVAAVGADAPARLTIPAIGLDEPLVPGGLDEAGTVNPDRGEAMWFQGHGRAVPGDVGIALITAHVEYYGEPDVFAELADVAVGEELTLTQTDGDKLQLTVVQTETVQALRSSDLVWGEESTRRLVALVTCDDELGWRPDGHRAANHVVLAEVTG